MLNLYNLDVTLFDKSITLWSLIVWTDEMKKDAAPLKTHLLDHKLNCEFYLGLCCCAISHDYAQADRWNLITFLRSSLSKQQYFGTFLATARLVRKYRWENIYLSTRKEREKFRSGKSNNKVFFFLETQLWTMSRNDSKPPESHNEPERIKCHHIVYDIY